MAHGKVCLQPNALAYPLITQLSTKLVGLGGFEPPMTEPKSVVLPLHHSPVIGASLHIRPNALHYIVKHIDYHYLLLLMTNIVN